MSRYYSGNFLKQLGNFLTFTSGHNEHHRQKLYSEVDSVSGTRVVSFQIVMSINFQNTIDQLTHGAL